MKAKQTQLSGIQRKTAHPHTLVRQRDGWKKVSIILGVLMALILVSLIFDKQDGKEPPARQVTHDLACFVKNVRSISSDPIVVRSRLETAYAFTTRKAKRQLDGIIRELNLSGKLSQRITVSVDITSAKLTNSSICIVAWTETIFEGNKKMNTKVYDGYFRIKYATPKSPLNGYPVNPSGIYINNIKIEEAKDNEQKS